MKLADLYLETRQRMIPSEGVQEAGFYARQILTFTSGMRQDELLTASQKYVEDGVIEKTRDLTERFLSGEPLAYLLGEWEFYGLPLYVDRRVLIPRDDTVAVTQLALEQAIFLPKNPRILDLCTGSGCIGIAIATKIADAKVTLADLSRDALAVAKQNVNRHHLTSRVSCLQANALEKPSAFLGKFDMIVSNPPYITSGEMNALPSGVKDYEPHMALYGGEDGLDFYRAIIQNYTACLKKGGFLCFEFGMSQGDSVAEELIKNGYTILERTRDYNDRERAILARLDREDVTNGNEENKL